MHSGCDTDQLQTDRQASAYYDQRYTGEYMQDWPEAKLQRVERLIRSLDLPEAGIAVDLGCGVGVFSRVLKTALPGWSVIGLEISPNAVAAARARHRDIDFRLLGETDLGSINADFVFSHHVLEHVIDLGGIWEQTRLISRPGALVLHILPCGDASSFEHRLSHKQIGGVDTDNGNRFFYEDPGHVRRLTWLELCKAAEPFGFTPGQVRYANRFWGGLSWISKIAPGKAKAMAMPTHAKGLLAKAELIGWRFVLGTLSRANRWKQIWSWRRGNAKGLKGVASLGLGWPTGMAGLAVCGVLDALAEAEWRRDSTTTGSEMYALVQAPLAEPVIKTYPQRNAA